jgi:CheY-like chemotaxis protein
MTAVPGKLRILLADDSRFFRAIEAQFLQKTPVDITEADCTDVVMSSLKSGCPDLIFMAYSLKGDGGDECCRKIKSDPGFKNIPVVMICDQNEPAQVDNAKDAGCDAYLIKPLDRRSFLQVGRQFLEGIREHRQPMLFPVLFSAAGEEYSGKCLDISGGGMFVETVEDIAAGSLVNLTFRLPDGIGTQFVCCAEVKWVNRKPNPMKPHYPHGLGLRFIELPDVLQRAVIRMTDQQKS